MKKILIIGGGAMGSAFTIPCVENKNKVISIKVFFIIKNNFITSYYLIKLFIYQKITL